MHWGAGKGLIELFGPWTRWVVIGYGVAILGVLVGALFMRLRERRTSRTRTTRQDRQGDG